MSKLRINKFVSDDIVLSAYQDSSECGYGISLEIDLNDHIDWYSYHDAPRSVTLRLTLADLKILGDQITKAVQDVKELSGNLKS